MIYLNTCVLSKSLVLKPVMHQVLFDVEGMFTASSLVGSVDLGQGQGQGGKTASQSPARKRLYRTPTNLTT